MTGATNLSEAAQPEPPGIVRSSDGLAGYAQTLRELLACCHAWGPNVRVMGNVRAGDAAAAIAHVLQHWHS
jgi:hypothetical protein